MEFLAGNTGLPVKSFRHENTLMQLAEYFRHKCFMPEGILHLKITDKSYMIGRYKNCLISGTEAMAAGCLNGQNAVDIGSTASIAEQNGGHLYVSNCRTGQSGKRI